MLRLCAALSLVLLTGLRAPDAGDDQYQFLYGLQRKGLHELVVKEATAFLHDFPRHEKADLARYRLASSLFELDRYGEAALELERLTDIEGFEFEAEVWFRLGQCRLERGEHAEAVRAFEHVLETDADYLALSARFLLGEAHFQLGEYREADAAYSSVLAGGKEGEHARDAAYGLAWCAYRLGRHDAAVERIHAFLERWPTGEIADELRHLQGEAEMAAGRPERALEAFRSVPAGAFREAALHGAGFAAAELGDDLGAARSFATLIDEYPESRFAAEAVLQLGVHLIAVGQHENALVALSLPQAKPDAQLHFWRARAQVELGRYEDALQSLELAGRADPDDELAEQVQVARGDVLFRLGRTEEATRAYRESGSEYALHAAAVASFNEGDSREAVRLARTLLERFPEGSYADAARLTLGEALFALEQYPEARTQFLAFLESASDAEDSQLAGARLRVGWCAYLTGDMNGAAAAFSEVAGADPDPAMREEALFLEGRAREELGETEGARRAFETCAADYPAGAHAAPVQLALSRLRPGDEGVGNLDAIARDFPESEELAPALLELGERHAGAGRYEQARRAYARLRTDRPESELVPAALYGEAWADYSLDRHEDALELLRLLDGLEGLPEELRLASLELCIFAADRADRPAIATEAWGRFARGCRDEGRLVACARAVAGVLDRSGKRPDARRLLDEVAGSLREPATARAARIEAVWMALSDDDVPGAESELRRALALGSSEPSVCEAAFFVGEAHYEAGEDESATALYRLASAEESPVADRALYKQGFAQLRLEQPREAERAFAELVENHQGSELWGEGLFLLGEARFRAGEYAPAAEAFRRLLDEVPGHAVVPRALYRLGTSLCQLERWEEAERALTDLARRFPDFENGVEAELWRGRALAARGATRPARQAFERVLARDEGVLAARARLGLGHLALAGDDVETALSEFLKVALLYASEEEVAEALLYSGRCLELKGDPERAREQYAELLEKYPRSSSAPEARERLGS